ncbi:nickel/cobalt ABC transporter permease [Methanosarcina horonobensis]|nr:nickel/cobalt ABC transporter permease [Methanosarcina horonobensis]
MRAYVIKRIFAAVPLFFIISFCSFLLINLSPTDPAEAALRANDVPVVTQELVEQTREQLGLDRPFLIRYGNWLSDSLHLNFGQSYVKRRPVSSLILPAFLNTLKLVTVTSVTVIFLSTAFGVFCALREGSRADKVTRGVLFAFTAVPSYWVGILMIWFFAVRLNLLPTSGMGSAAHYILPVAVMSSGYIGFYFRLIRNSMVRNNGENYVLYEKASGLPDRLVNRHILRNSLQTAVSGFCMAVPGMLAGTVVVENVFAWPGIGRLCVSAIFDRDLPVVQAYIIVVAAFFILFNLIADLVNAAINPKLREE